MSNTNVSSNKEALIARCLPFLEEVKDMTPGTEVEQWLNSKYGPDSELYQTLARLITIGVVEEGWAADVEVNGPQYRRARLVAPTDASFGFSITSVYMDSSGNLQQNPEDAMRGDFHAHPYGEFNMVIPLNEGAALAGPNGWCYGGWTAPGPGSRHYPETKGGAVIALFFLPAGRISYNVTPPGVEASAASSATK
ncbi:hypothetical protein GCM10027093_27820 [Paraburkholderia jirisanensis]